jgi:hypothetical protein
MIKNSKTVNDLRKAGSIGTEDGKLRYLEFQTFGKVLGSDITDIVFHNSYGRSANYSLSQRVFGEDSITGLVQKLQAKGIKIHHDHSPAISKISTLRGASLYDKYLGTFKKELPYISQKKDHIYLGFELLSIIDLRHNILLSMSQSLNNYKYKNFLLKNTQTDNKIRGIFSSGLQEKISPDELKEYNIVINKMISQIKKYDPKFFDDFEKHTGKKIDFDDRPKF